MNNQNIEGVILFQIDLTGKVAKQYSQREFDRLELGITVDQWVLLKIIHEKQPISQRDLATLSFRDPASITRTLDLLQKKGLAVRESIPDNRRQYHIFLTDEGEAFVQKHLPLVLEHRRKSIEGLSEQELDSLVSILKKIQTNMT